MADSALDLATCCCDVWQRAGPWSVVAMSDSALDLAACCYDVRQRAGPQSVVAMSDSATTPANAALQRFCFCFCFKKILPDNLKREK
jgi:hypothetical protein